MSKPQCLKTQIEKCENTLEHIGKILHDIEKTPIHKRDSGQNETYFKNRPIYERLLVALDWMKFDEKSTDHFHVDVVEPTELVIESKTEGNQNDSAYLI